MLLAIQCIAHGVTNWYLYPIRIFKTVIGMLDFYATLSWSKYPTLLSSYAVLTYCCNQENFEILKTLGLLKRRRKPDNMARCVSGINLETNQSQTCSFILYLFIYANYAGNKSRSCGIAWPNLQIIQLILVMQILFVDHFCFEKYFKNGNLIIFDTIIGFFSVFPNLLWTLVVTDNSPFHGLVIFIVFSAQYLPAVLPLLFRHLQTSSTFSSFLHVSTLLWSSLFRVWDYDDRFLCRDFPFSCLGHSVICSFK